ncbi:MAG: hypothetical protein AAF361_07175 [Bacteroidota bacterium]
MKKHINILKSSAIALAMLMIGCEDGDLPFDDITADVTRGAVLRTVSQTGTFFDRNDTSTSWALEFEEQDQEDGALLSKVDLFVGFDDNTEGNGTVSPAEVLVQTINASEFQTGEFGLPRANVSSTFAEALSALGLVAGQFDGGDAIEFRLLLTLTDGRTFTNTDNTGTITGSFFSSPFLYRLVIKCVPTAPVPGDYEITLNDSFGDGWDGAFITVTIDGTATEYTIDDGSEASFDINVPMGTTELLFEYTAGNFEGEHTYEIIGPTGDLAVEDGPSPNVGEITLSICI